MGDKNCRPAFPGRAFAVSVSLAGLPFLTISVIINPMKTKTAILTDFDGTLTTEDVSMRIYEKFAKEPCPCLNQRWAEGTISTMQELEGCFATITATREQMEKEIRRVDFDPGFSRLIALCREESIPLSILSDGLDWYIRLLLESNGFGEVPFYANQIEFTPGGFRFTYPWFDPQNPMRGVWKPTIIHKFQAEGYRVIFIGDGLTDTDAARAADVLFAKEALYHYCGTHGIPAIPYNNLLEVVSILQAQLLDHNNPEEAEKLSRRLRG